jgi:hypothetical protein
MLSLVGELGLPLPTSAARTWGVGATRSALERVHVIFLINTMLRPGPLGLPIRRLWGW